MPRPADLAPAWAHLAIEIAHHLAEHMDARVADAQAASPWYDVRQARGLHRRDGARAAYNVREGARADAPSAAAHDPLPPQRTRLLDA